MSFNGKENVAISASHVKKIYKIFDTPGQQLIYHLFHNRIGRDFVALEDISFEVKKGETFGIIGRNGSGKSTLLQILAGIIDKTEGDLYVNGRVAALLELGSGFDPESTGYENIYMNAAILGVGKNDIDMRVKDIIEFADIGDFIDQPVKTYSSGMFIRLAFAVAINVDADILLIDEALAVGDVFFRQKCYNKLNELKAAGKTIVLVSHGMTEVEQFCDRTLLIDKSKQMYLGDSKAAVNYYYLLDQNSEISNVLDSLDNTKNVDEQVATAFNDDEQVTFSNHWKITNPIFSDINRENEISTGGALFDRIGVFDSEGKPRTIFEQGEKAFFYAELTLKKDIEIPLFGVELINQKGIIVHGKDLLQLNEELPQKVRKGCKIVFLQVITLDVEIGEYTINYGSSTVDKETYSNRMKLKQEEVDSHVERLSVMVNAANIAVAERKIGYPMKQAFHGLCDLPGTILIDVM